MSQVAYNFTNDEVKELCFKQLQFVTQEYIQKGYKSTKTTTKDNTFYTLLENNSDLLVLEYERTIAIGVQIISYDAKNEKLKCMLVIHTDKTIIYNIFGINNTKTLWFYIQNDSNSLPTIYIFDKPPRCEEEYDTYENKLENVEKENIELIEDKYLCEKGINNENYEDVEYDDEEYEEYEHTEYEDVEYEHTEYEDEEVITPDEACKITFEIPKEGCRVYLVNEFPEYKPIWHKNVSTYEDINKIYFKLFSQIHGCMPFEITDYNSAYKEECEYPEIPEEIMLFEEIAKEITDNIRENIECVYFMCVINNEGDEIFTALLTTIHNG